MTNVKNTANDILPPLTAEVIAHLNSMILYLPHSGLGYEKEDVPFDLNAYLDSFFQTPDDKLLLKNTTETLFQRKNYQEAALLYHEAAEKGHAGAQYELGNLYATVLQDRVKAKVWFLRAAEQGHLDAQFQIGLFYAHGNGVTENREEAVKWVRKSAEKGFPDAQYFLGQAYTHGRGVKKNYEEAIKWLRKASERGDDRAQCLLGELYAKGCGVKPNSTKAIELSLKSAKQGNPYAYRNLNLFLCG